MKKAGFFVDSKNFSDSINFDCLEYDNPGVGGTQWITLQVVSKLSNIDSLEIYLFVTKKIPLKEHITQIVTSDFLNAHSIAFDLKLDLFVFDDYQILNSSALDQIKLLDIDCAVWTNTHFSSKTADLISESENILVNVFVGNQQFDYYLDHKIIRKSVVIRNAITITNTKKRVYYDNTVTYLGALYYSKYFHVLAKSWKKVLKKVPDAKLVVIGAGNLYSDKHKLGELGLADESYEKLFLNYLLDENGEIHSSVTFLGKLGPEKSQFLSESKVGVVNPTGITECLPLSVLEFCLHGVPIVTKNAWAYPDLVLNNKTGLLYSNEKQISNYIVKLLKNDELNRKLGENAVEFVTKFYNLDFIVEDWCELILSLDKELKFKKVKPSPPYFNQLKFLKIIKLWLSNNTKIVTPSVIEIEEKLKHKIKFSGNFISKRIMHFHNKNRP